jgi:hypothetical protein
MVIHLLHRLREVELSLGKAEGKAESEGRGRKEAEALAEHRQQQLVQVGPCAVALQLITQQTPGFSSSR